MERLGRSLVQHGPASDRVYLMKLAWEDFPRIVKQLRELANRHRYTKVFAKVPAGARGEFEADGYRVEARVPGFYNGEADGLFMACYRHPDRKNDPAASRVRKVLDAARAAGPALADVGAVRGAGGLPRGMVCPLSGPVEDALIEAGEEELVCRPAEPEDCEAMAALYDEVFASYPFPIYDPAYLRQTMAAEVIYAGVWCGKRPVALASAELDRAHANAEMTDFATRPEARGHGYALLLLHHLERRVRKLGIKTCYTIARATSFAMNLTFARGAYTYAGTLVRNTQIAGQLESMNVWYKKMPCRPAQQTAAAGLKEGG
jgi:putative beta-lysine N-acetyltransferase